MPGAQVSLLEDTRKLRSAVGDALQAFVEVNPSVASPCLKQRWVEAMYWFGQARREENDFIALVKIGIALDVLAKGGKTRGILALSIAILDKEDDYVIASDGLKLGKLVEKLYEDGRSQIAHGGRLALLNQLPLPLQVADEFAAQILIGYVVCLEKYTGPDEYEQFLAAIPAIRGRILNEYLSKAGSDG